MMLLGPLVIVGSITAIVLAVQHATRHGAAPPPSVPRSEHVPALPHAGRSFGLSGTLDRWVAADLLSADQAAAILDHERSVAAARAPGRRVETPAPRRRIPVFANYGPDLATSAACSHSLG